MQWEIVIGLETHAQLNTLSKIFSGAPTAYGAEPNTQACAVDIALPGVLPVFNRVAAEKAVKFGLAIGARINRRSVFERKNYFYPDLPKGYQTTQLALPIVAEGGTLQIQVGDREKTVRITRAHLEEDAGKSLHEDFHGMTGIDLNRAGTPLIEIVTEPDLRSSAEAVSYAKKLHSLVRWIGICDGNMQEGSFRCDANVSVRPMGVETLGTRCEIKNLNSFKFMEKAIDFEVRRQIEVLEDGGRIVQETRLYDPDRDETRSMRSKEEANDYRYFPDPDLLPLVVGEVFLDQARATMPELPQAMRERFVSDYGLPAYDADILTASRELAAYFEDATATLGEEAKLCANWIMGDLSAQLNKEGFEITNSPIAAGQLAGLLKRIVDGTISGKIAKEVFAAMWAGEGDADAIIAAKGLKQVSDSGAIEKIVDEIIAVNPAQVAEYRSGKEKVFGFFVGLAMKASKGKANPAQLNEILKKRLAG
ncbi:MAG: Asp-tRNA(Asn)/Glu-tRNA(Gln) amidotransferase GatCAB subunit B [Hydrogenophilales bacterium CG_4_9_14_3_um_filter_59_35]|nr:MAG: Asp-tRNA(Asn)/Glu-tRNA(Gln) amidotransferase GatCAB subunit B [Hydrogenophilales bacterium CG18_big_fil_WC_8_21_14_2_50_58_12]PIX99915.1 MAG: Asp-tRNA(Asn)/Glu-tRNA(Gln) amidotransferase GatCAB subunit B [Hydrogenophilales bacterium CG_4_10_14_3_um_filter_58_23]PJB07493.1 MAG: Asp-tRNA(Asn)/Glu-tRNA(Gln) amidotransferase GatCAB subunit B [Hydrogenophilales bacterium CG_4_9_14_3_um_filter_59_35]